MAFITLRQANVVQSPGGTVKGSPLTNDEVDNNFANINIVVGFRENLTTTANDNLVAAVNEIRSELNNLSPSEFSNGTSNVSIAVANGDIEVSANFIPYVSNTLNLGSETRRFKDIYLSGNTINLGGDRISASGGFIKINDNNIFSTDGRVASSNVKVLSATGNTVELKANASLASNVSFIFPTIDGASGQAIATDASGKLIFETSAEFESNTVALFGQTSAPTGWTKDISTYNNHALRCVTGTCSSGGSVDFTAAFSSQTLTGNVAVSASMGNVTQGGTITIGAVTQGGSVSITTGNVTQGGSVSGSTGQEVAPFSVGATTLSTPQIPSHNHNIGSNRQSSYGGGLAARSPDTGGPATSSTGGGGSHSHPVGPGGSQHAHPIASTFTGQSHAHPAPASFVGDPHSHSASFTGQSHAHPISAAATFTGDPINLAVKYVDVIRAVKD